MDPIDATAERAIDWADAPGAGVPLSFAPGTDDRGTLSAASVDALVDAQDIGDQRFFLSAAPPSRPDWRLASAVALFSLFAFVAVAPFAKVQLPVVPAFVPAYESALLINDLITAVLLFGQFGILRSRAVLVLGGGYLFSGLMAIPHALTFPGVFAPTGLLGAGPQTTSWLYISWHILFPLVVIAYALLKQNHEGITATSSARAAVACAAATAVGGVIGLTAVAIMVEPSLPPILAGIHYTSTAVFSLVFAGAVSLAAFVVLSLRRPHTRLDLWLMVVMCAWLFDVGLSAVLNNGRYDLGFYAGRIYVLLGASFVLAVMLVETTRLYARLAGAARRVTDHAAALEEGVRRRTLELQRSNDALVDREDQLNRAQRLARIGSDHRDLRTGQRQWSNESYRIFGVSPESFAPTPENVLSLVHPDDRGLVFAGREKAAAGTCPDPFEYRVIRPDGEVRHVYREWELMRDAAGTPVQLLGTIHDITERRRTEEQLRQAQKMEAIGNLTGGMAHDFNNLLGVIIGNLDLLRDRQSGDAEAEELSREALDAALRGADLTRRLLAFARRQPLQPKRIHVNELVTGISNLLKRTLGEEIEIGLDPGSEIWPVVVDPAQLESSLTNLATNARDAMPKGGRLMIVTGNRHLDEDYASQHAEVQPGDYAMIEVSDTGTGIPPEIASRIFEPFYTTKEQGKGTGLGLSMVFGFMKQSGGHINVYSEVGIGTTFRLYLPRVDAAAATSAAAPSEPLVRGRGETVLAVEDNTSLRRVVVRQLSELGYRVLEADNVQTALEVLEGERVDLLFTDIVMPGGTSGYELACAAQARWTDVKVVLTSGFPESRFNDDGRLRNMRLLSKPYRRDELARTIREVLGKTPAP